MTRGRMDANVEEESKNSVTSYQKNVANFETYFKKSYDLFNEFKLLIYETSLSERDRLALTGMNRPTLEANMLPALINARLGEFSAQEFAYSIKPSEELEIREQEDEARDNKLMSHSPHTQNSGMQQIPPNQNMFPQPTAEHVKDIKLSQVLGDHLNYELSAKHSHDAQYQFMKDLLIGGWSVFEIEMDYDHPMCMVPRMRLVIPEDRTLCGFDPKARLEDKSDGDFCYKKYSVSRNDVALYFPEANVDSIEFGSSVENDPWAYKTGDQEIVVVCKYWKKIKRKLDIVKLAGGDVVPLDLYKKMVRDGKDITREGEPRTTIIEKIQQVIFIKNQLIEEKDTDFSGLPLIFGRGDGDFVKHASNQSQEERCIPYAYHAKDAQRLKNFTMNSLANEIENIIQHKLMVAVEAYPDQPQWQAAYTDYQNQMVLFFKSRYPDSGEPIMNPVSPVPRQVAPPEIFQTYSECDRTINNLLGSSQAPSQSNIEDLSGEAIMQAQMQSNPTAMAYVTGMSHALQRVAQVYVDTLPALIEHYDTLPILKSNAKEEKIKLTKKMKNKFSYYPKQMRVQISVGASYQIQKRQALMMVQKLMQMSPNLEQFFSTEGLNYVLDNLDGKNIDALKLKIEAWVQKQMQMQQQQQQAQMQESQQNPAVLKVHAQAQSDQQRLQLDAKKNENENILDKERLAMDHFKIVTDKQIAELKINTDKQIADLRAQLDDKKIQADLLKATDESVHKIHDRRMESAEIMLDHMKEKAGREHEMGMAHMNNSHQKDLKSTIQPKG